MLTRHVRIYVTVASLGYIKMWNKENFIAPSGIESFKKVWTAQLGEYSFRHYEGDMWEIFKTETGEKISQFFYKKGNGKFVYQEMSK